MADWQSIVRAHGPMAFQTGWRLLGNADDTEECVQEALLDAFRLYARQPIENWGGLLRRLTTRRAIDRLRTRNPTCEISVDAPGKVADQPESAAIVRELADRLRSSIAQLPDQQASVFALHYFAQMTRAEIAGVLEVTENSVGVALHKARTKLKIALGFEQPNNCQLPSPHEQRHKASSAFADADRTTNEAKTRRPQSTQIGNREDQS